MSSDQVNHSSTPAFHQPLSHQMSLRSFVLWAAKTSSTTDCILLFFQWFINTSFYFLVLISILCSNVHCTSMSIENINLTTNSQYPWQLTALWCNKCTEVSKCLFCCQWIPFWISVFILMYHFCPDCSYGLQTGLISDSRLSSSSVLNGKFLAPYGRLRNRTSAWCARGYEQNFLTSYVENTNHSKQE